MRLALVRVRNDQAKEGAETITIAASVGGAYGGGVDECADAPPSTIVLRCGAHLAATHTEYTV